MVSRIGPRLVGRLGAENKRCGFERCSAVRARRDVGPARMGSGSVPLHDEPLTARTRGRLDAPLPV
jgi:hypothetical protein